MGRGEGENQVAPGLRGRLIPEVREIDSYDWDRFVKEKLGYSDYEFIPTEEVGNDTQHSFHVPPNPEIDKWDQETLDRWAKGEFVNFSTRVIFEEMVRQGHIPPGHYLIRVSW